MNGLAKWKREHKDFVNILETNDVICITESWLSEIESKSLSRDLENNFTVFYSCRRKNKRAKRDSGGIIIFIKRTLSEHFTVIQQQDEDIVWLKINKNISNYTSDIYMCCTYISPRSSCRYVGEDTSKLEILHNDVIKYKCIGHVIILGDLNCRTGTVSDLADPPGLNNFVVIPNYEQTRTIDDIIKESNNNIKKQRISSDTIVNGNGRELLSLCKTNHI